MNQKSTRFSALVRITLVAVLAACGGAETGGPTQIGPTESPPTPSTPAPPQKPSYPALVKPGVIYGQATPSSLPGDSRYVLYSDSSFVLQILRPDKLLEYAGRYAGTDSLLVFSFADNGGRWEAKGVLEGGWLAVRYNTDMSLSDFENGTFVRAGPDATFDYIFVMDPGSATPRRLVEGNWPAWSPDGRQIAFQRDGIRVVDVDGRNERLIGPGRYPSWSPDGRRLAFTSAQGIAVMNVDGGDVTTLVSHHFRKDTYAPGDMGVGKPAWSPDGKQIAFEHFGDGETQPAQIFITASDGSNAHPVTAGPIHYAESDPVWSPDGAQLAFWSYGYRIATVPADGGTPTSVYGGTVWYGPRPAWSPDGRKLAFTMGLGTAEGPSLVVFASGSASLLIKGGRDAAWSRANGLIAYVAPALR